MLRNYELFIVNEQKHVLRQIGNVYRLVVKHVPRGDYSKMQYLYYSGGYSHVFVGYGMKIMIVATRLGFSYNVYLFHFRFSHCISREGLLFTDWS